MHYFSVHRGKRQMVSKGKAKAWKVIGQSAAPLVLDVMNKVSEEKSVTSLTSQVCGTFW